MNLPIVFHLFATLSNTYQRKKEERKGKERKGKREGKK